MTTPTPPPSEPGRDGLGRRRENEPGAALTARERRAFDEIEQRLRGELARRRRASILWTALIGVGTVVVAIGLLTDNVAVSFAGFVAVVIGVERFTHARTTHRWRGLVARWTGWRGSKYPDRTGPTRPGT